MDLGAARAHCKWGIPGMLIGDEELDFARIEQAKAAFSSSARKARDFDGTWEGEGARPVENVPRVLLASSLVADHSFPARIRNLAQRKGIATLSDLLAVLSSAELQDGIGAGTLAETKALIEASSIEPDPALDDAALSVLSSFCPMDGYGFGLCGELVKIPENDTSDEKDGWLSDRYCEEALAVPLCVLNLPSHLEGRLSGNGFATVGDVLAAGEEGLLGIRQFGPGKAAEVMSALEAFLAPYKTEPEVCEELDAPVVGDAASEEACCVAWNALFTKGYPVEEKALAEYARCWASAARNNGISFGAKEIVAAVEGSDVLVAACEEIVARNINGAIASAKLGIWPEPICIPNGKAWAEAARRAAKNKEGFAFEEDRSAVVAAPSTLDEWLGSLPEDKASIMRMRFSGMTISDIGKRKALTSQRIHQIIAKELGKRPLLAEDRYRHLYECYALKLSDFCDVTKEPAQAYRYLAEVSDRRGKAPLKKALADDGVPEAVKCGIRALTGGEYLIVDGERIHRDRESVIEHLVRRYATDSYIGRNELHRLYLDFMRKHGLESAIAEGDLSEPSFTGRLQRRPYVLYAPAGQGRGAIRYYDFEGRDFAELKRYVLEIGYENVEISSALIFERPDAAAVMAGFDIRDGYELYAILKRVFEGDDRVVPGRVPHLSFGEADRSRQILDLIAEIGPVDSDGLASAYRKRYGVREDTFKANFAKAASSCLRGGMYSASRGLLTEEQRTFLEGQLVGDLVPVELVRSRYRAEFPDAETPLVGPGSAAEFGYALDGDLLVREGADLAGHCARLIAGHPLFKKGDPGFESAVFESDAFKAELAKAQRSLDVLECAKGEYANVRCLAALDEPVTKEELADFVEKTLEFMDSDEPYTVARLRSEGYAHSLDRLERDLGMGDWAFASLICLACAGGRVKRVTWKDDIVFWKAARPISMPVVVEWAMEGKGCCTVADLCDEIEGRLGFAPSEYEMRGILRRSDLLFKDDIGMVFENEEAYESKVREALGI